MEPVRVFVETGKKKVFVGAVDWPGWSRGGKDESAALQALLAYGPRYAAVLQPAGMRLALPSNLDGLEVVERTQGNGSTDFGLPAVALEADHLPLAAGELARLGHVLEACWQAFDRAVAQAAGHELKKGPRGGGREVEQIIDHVGQAEQAYLGQIAWKNKLDAASPQEMLDAVRRSALEALAAAAAGALPAQRPRGGEPWPIPYFIRRAAWHVMDHAWEIEDRIL